MLEPPKLDRFEIRRLLGRGGAGDVYLAWDRLRGKEVALKLVRTGVGDPEILPSERSGALLQQQLGERIPQIAQVYDVGETAELFWVAMEYVAGDDLSRVLAVGPLSEHRAVGIAVQLCDLLQRLQKFVSESAGRRKLGVVHGDLKPENIRLQEGDRVRILDFGIAKPLSVSRSFTRNPFGSLPYIPPERLRTGQVDAHSDPWAVGIILYRMVSGRLPFLGNTSEEVERQILHGDLLPLHASCSRPLQWIVYKSLAHQPSDRYPTAAALRADLEVLRDGRPPRPASASLEEALEKTRPQRSAAAQPGGAPTDRGSNTRRTKFGAVAAPAGNGASASRRSSPMRLVPMALLSLGLLGAASQAYVWTSARQLQGELLAAPVSEVALLWERYQQLDRLSFLDLGMDGVREEMKMALEKAGEVILETAGSDASGAPEDWEAAHRHFSAVLEIDESDLAARARAAYCRAQIALATAVVFEENGDDEAAGRKRNEAVAELREAARLDGSWAAPHLGLAGLYAQSDLAALEAALEAAESRSGADPQLSILLRADGHLEQAQRLYSQAVRARGSEQEPELLAEAIRHLDQAVDRYSEISGYLRAGSRRIEAERLHAAVEGRLSDLGY